MTDRVKTTLAILGFVLAAVVAGVLGGYVEARAGVSWLKWVLLAAVVVPAVILFLRRIETRQKQ
ncbi:hypothetical protein AB0I60_20210 [Actinosynnema sp. NPDC050436]|uniref:hypothetical protein n=1 Tax=Actinosynnema sp. NPDC050436 TaxID=3155659 RepID=UPI0033EC3D0D